jgi:hypothetical protein
MSIRPRLLRSVTSLAVLALLPCAMVPAARAQSVVRVWTPPAADSVLATAAEAKARFHSNPGDSAGGENYRAYEAVGLIGRRLLRSLGRENQLQAYAIKPVLDSLGFVTEVAMDPAVPEFVLLMVRNPYRLSAEAVGFLYWPKGDELRIQGAVFRGGYRPRIRVWWTGKPEVPYQWGIIDETRAGVPRFTLLRLSPGGTMWGIQQDEERFPLLGEPGEAQWADLNRDGLPELVSWTRSPTDSLFLECPNCPRLLTERTFVEGREGFELQDERLLPSPYATLVYFVRLLIDGKSAQAERLVRDPGKVSEALMLGWNKRVVPHPWQVEYRESGQPWPRWLEARFEGPLGVKRYVFHFGLREGHWIIENWVEPKPVGGRYPSVVIPPAPATQPPAANPPARRVVPPIKKR